MTKMMARSIAALITAAFLFVAVTFAWFTSSFQVDQDDILLDFNPTDFEFALYRFRDASFAGRNDELLFSVSCVAAEDDRCFEPHVETDLFQFPNPFGFRPGQSLAFALTVTNLGEAKSFDLELFDVSSLGYLLSDNAVQRAFEYRVERLSYWNGSVEDATLIDHPSIDYAGKNVLLDTHFALVENAPYQLANNVPLGDQTDDKTAIVYFTLSFDPSIAGVDALGQSTGNSNAFQNQTMQIEGLRLKKSEGGM